MNKFGTYTFPEVVDVSTVDRKDLCAISAPDVGRRGDFSFPTEEIERVALRLSS